MASTYEGTIPTRAFGRSGDKISILGFGGHHLGEAADEKTAVEIVHHPLTEFLNVVARAVLHRQFPEFHLRHAALSGIFHKPLV